MTENNKNIYKVKEGDSLYKIASMYNITTDDLLSANPYLNPMYLQKNLNIIIPEPHDKNTNLYDNKKKKRRYLQTPAEVENAVNSDSMTESSAEKLFEISDTGKAIQHINTELREEALRNFSKLYGNRTNPSYAQYLYYTMYFELLIEFEEILSELFGLYGDYIGYVYINDFLQAQHTFESINNKINQITNLLESIQPENFNSFMNQLQEQKKMLTELINNANLSGYKDEIDSLNATSFISDRYKSYIDSVVGS